MKHSGLYVLSIIVGIFAGAVCIPFRYVVSWVSGIRPYIFGDEAELFGVKSALLTHVVVFITIYLILMIVALLVKHFPKISGSGLPQTQALLYGRIVYSKPFTYLFVKFIGGIFSLGSGLSLGREGTSVQMGSLTGYLTGSLFRVKQGLRRHLIAAGAGAGIAAAFTAPLSSSILILESLQKFSMPQTAICTLLAGTTAGIMAKLTIPSNIYGGIPTSTPNTTEWKLIVVFFFMALFFAIIGKLFSRMLIIGKTWYSQLDTWKYSYITKNTFSKVAILTVVIFTVGLFFPTMIGGDQTFLVTQASKGHENIFFLIALIVVISAFTILSNSSAYPGGIFLPMMTVGGLAGKLFYELLFLFPYFLGQDYNLSGYFVLIGMSAFFISVVRTPLTGFILISEMTGHYEVFFPALIVGTLVYYFTQMLKVEPMNDILYKFMISTQKDQPIRSTIYLEVGPDSYFAGKTIQTLTLPQNCTITNIQRNKQNLQFINTTILIEGDQIAIEINSNEMEKVYQPLVSMSI
ncbi:MAG: chloride channel protein [Bacteroidales bacterium]